MAVFSYCENIFYNELFCFPVSFSISTHITGGRFSFDFILDYFVLSTFMFTQVRLLTL